MMNEGISGGQCHTTGPYGQCVHSEGHKGKCTTFVSGNVRQVELPTTKRLKEVASALVYAQLDERYEPFLFEALSDLMRAVGRLDAASAADRLKEGRNYDDGYDEGYKDGQHDGHHEGYDEGFNDGHPDPD